MKLITSDPLNFTKLTGWGGSAAATAIAAYTLIANEATGLSEPLTIALIGLSGILALGAAIASAGDVLARAYVTANAVPDPEDAENTLPVLAVIGDSLAKAQLAAHTVPDPDDSDKTLPALSVASQALANAYRRSHTVRDPAEPDKRVPVLAELAHALRELQHAPRQLAVPPVSGVRWQGKDATILAVEVHADGQTRFMVARGTRAPEWVDSNAVTFP